MRKNHLLDFDALDLAEFFGELIARFFVAAHFKHDQAVGRAELAVDFVKAEAGLDTAAVFGEERLNHWDVFGAAGDVYAENNVFFHLLLPF
jgi:hypothetical protein